jgi:hypothetical protein
MAIELRIVQETFAEKRKPGRSSMSGSLLFQFGKGAGFTKLLHFLGRPLANVGELGFSLGEAHGVIRRDFFLQISQGLNRFGVTGTSVAVSFLEVILKEADVICKSGAIND